MEICPSKLAEYPVAPISCVRHFRIAQSIFKKTSAIILFNECEEILNLSQSTKRGDVEGSVLLKSYINKKRTTYRVQWVLWRLLEAVHSQTKKRQRFP